MSEDSNNAGWTLLAQTSGSDSFSFGKWLMVFGLMFYLAIQPSNFIQFILIIGGWFGLNQDASRLSNYLEILSVSIMCSGLLLLIWGWLSVKWKKVIRIIVLSTYNPLDLGAIRRVLNPVGVYWPKIVKLADLPGEAPKDIKRCINKISKIALKIRGVDPVYFVGIAHIPFVSLIGFLTRNYHFDCLEIDHASKKPILLTDNINLSNLAFTVTQDSIKSDHREVAFAISLSREIDRDIILRSLTTDVPVVCVKNQNIQEMPYDSREQLDKAILDVRNIFLKVTQPHQNIKHVHLFYAGPTSFILGFSKLINQNTDPVVTVYNYKRGQGYNWGITLSRKGKYVQLS